MNQTHTSLILSLGRLTLGLILVLPLAACSGTEVGNPPLNTVVTVSPTEPLSLTLGELSLDIPAGAVEEELELTIRSGEDKPADLTDKTPLTQVYRFYPEGQQLLKPATIQLTVSDTATEPELYRSNNHSDTPVSIASELQGGKLQAELDQLGRVFAADTVTTSPATSLNSEPPVNTGDVSTAQTLIVGKLNFLYTVRKIASCAPVAHQNCIEGGPTAQHTSGAKRYTCDRELDSQIFPESLSVPLRQNFTDGLLTLQRLDDPEELHTSLTLTALGQETLELREGSSNVPIAAGSYLLPQTRRQKFLYEVEVSHVDTGLPYGEVKFFSWKLETFHPIGDMNSCSELSAPLCEQVEAQSNCGSCTPIVQDPISLTCPL